MNKPSVMIIDDNPDNINLIRNALTDEYIRTAATSGSKGYSLLESAERLPDLILLDILMPEMDGFEFCKKLKKDPRFDHIPIIFMTGLSDISEKVRAFGCGAVDFIIKPFDVIEVRARVDLHIKLSNLKKELEYTNRNLESLVEEKVREVSETELAAVYSLARLVHHRDESSGYHLENMSEASKLIAQELKKMPRFRDIDDEFIESLFASSVLHDIGKVGIPDKVLLKPGKLTKEEFDVIKRHTIIGAQNLMEAYAKYKMNTIKMGIEICLSHHEKWDGSGYPYGLKGDAIPLSGRIVAVADVFDALLSSRPYKKAWTREEARAYIENSKGTHFDPDIADAFLRIEPMLDLTRRESVEFNYIYHNDVKIAVLESENYTIMNAENVLDITAVIQYRECFRLIIPVHNLPVEFYIPESGLAQTILYKFFELDIKVAITGKFYNNEFSAITGEFKHIFFADTVEEALEKLSNEDNNVERQRP